MIVVVDASVAVKWYVDEIFGDNAEKLLDGTFELYAPELIVPEFGNIVWKKVRSGKTTPDEGRTIIEAFNNQNMNLQPQSHLLKHAYLGAEWSGQTVYDWMYLVLAISLSCKFVTADERFYKALENTKMRKQLLWIGDLNGV